MMDYATYMDPVYASYLIHCGFSLQDLTYVNNAKQYCFGLQTMAYPLEEQFYGIDMPPAEIAYKDFIFFMNYLVLLEDMLLRQFSDRHVLTGRDARSKRLSFITTDQATAACLLEKGFSCWNVSHMGRNKGFKFYFNKAEKAEAAFISLMKSSETVPWVNLKYAWKRATCIRINRTNHRGNYDNQTQC